MGTRLLVVLLSVHVLLACGSTSTSRATPETGGTGGIGSTGGTAGAGAGGTGAFGGAGDGGTSAQDDGGGGIAGREAGAGGMAGVDAGPDAAGDGSAGSAALSQLGAACRLDAECASRHCADGVCCDGACDGLCAQCSNTGRCQAAADDTACSIIACVAGTNQCVAYDASISANRCRALGQCKTQADCGARPKPARSECTAGSSVPSLCNAASTCVVPRVSCNGLSCIISSNTCCHEFTREAQALRSLCVASADCPSTSFNAALEVTRTPISCDEHGDCRLGQLCSFQLSFTSSRIHCVPAADANQQGGFTPSAEVCQSPAASAPCSAGGCQRTYPQFPGWRFCAP